MYIANWMPFLYFDKCNFDFFAKMKAIRLFHPFFLNNWNKLLYSNYSIDDTSDSRIGEKFLQSCERMLQCRKWGNFWIFLENSALSMKSLLSICFERSILATFAKLPKINPPNQMLLDSLVALLWVGFTKVSIWALWSLANSLFTLTLGWLYFLRRMTLHSEAWKYSPIMTDFKC